MIGTIPQGDVNGYLKLNNELPILTTLTTENNLTRQDVLSNKNYDPCCTSFLFFLILGI